MAKRAVSCHLALPRTWIFWAQLWGRYLKMVEREVVQLQVVAPVLS
jgi:hypothetical protein